MGGPGHGVEEVQVIGQDAGGEQGLAQVHQAGRIRVDATKQDALIEQGRAAGLQGPQGRADGVVTHLAGMIGVDDEGDG